MQFYNKELRISFQLDKTKLKIINNNPYLARCVQLASWFSSWFGHLFLDLQQLFLSSEMFILISLLSYDSSLAHFTRAAVGPAAYRPISKTLLIRRSCYHKFPLECPTVNINKNFSHLLNFFIVNESKFNYILSYFFLFMLWWFSSHVNRMFVRQNRLVIKRALSTLEWTSQCPI